MKADVDLENVVLEGLRRYECAIASEEMGFKKFSHAPKNLFVVDPLDASENYARGMPNYVIGIARAPIEGSLKDVEEAYIFDLVTGDELKAS